MAYNYYLAMENDIQEYIKENYTTQEQLEKLEDREEWREELEENCWIVDSITGNGSGSYTFNRYRAKEYVIENLDLLRDSLECYDVDPKTIGDKFLDEDWEYFDVTIRCYMLGHMIENVLDNVEEYYNNILPIVKEN